MVPVHDVGTDRGPFLVTELVEGRNLGSVLTASGRQSPRDAARITSDIAAGVQAAHEQGIVHGDLKPGNILVGTDGRARVADFGIARAGGGGTAGALLGSAEYYSPEQARGEQAVPASDIYALGIILYELLTGVRPFAGATLNALATARLHEPAPDPRGAAPDVPDELASIVGKALATDPAHRYPSARAMRSDLVAWLDQQRSVPGTQARESAWQLRRRVLPVAIALLATGGRWIHRRARDRVERDCRTSRSGAGTGRAVHPARWRGVHRSDPDAEPSRHRAPHGGAQSITPSDASAHARAQISPSDSDGAAERPCTHNGGGPGSQEPGR